MLILHIVLVVVIVVVVATIYFLNINVFIFRHIQCNPKQSYILQSLLISFGLESHFYLLYFSSFCLSNHSCASL